MTFMSSVIDSMNVCHTFISAITIGEANDLGICGHVTGLRGTFVSGVCATLLQKALVCCLRLVWIVFGDSAREYCFCNFFYFKELISVSLEICILTFTSSFLLYRVFAMTQPSLVM